MAAVNWLHFSDFHQLSSDEWFASGLAERFIDDLKRVKNKGFTPDLIFFTGDAAFGHLGDGPNVNIADQLDQAEEFFIRVRDVFGTPKTSFYLVPGNHDVNRAHTVHGLYDWLDTMKRAGSGANLTKSISKNDMTWKTFMLRLQAYRLFLEKYKYKHCLTDPDRLIFWDSVRIHDFRVGIAGMNTAWSCGREGEARGDPWFASEYQVGLLSSKTCGNDFSIALMHHPLDWGNEIESPLERSALRTSFRFSLHGHEHDQAIQAESNHVRIAAGATSEQTKEQCGYNLVSFDPATGTGTFRGRTYFKKANRFDWSVLPEEGKQSGEKEFSLPALVREALTAKPGTNTPSAKVLTKHPKADGWTLREGVVIVLDLCGFTYSPPQAQMNGLGSLHKNLAARLPVRGSWNATATGAIISLPADLNLGASEIFAVLEELRTAIKADGVEMRIRAAIHTGVHFVVPGERLISASMFGSTINDARGLVRVGDADDVVVSHTFFDNYVRNDEEAMKSDFFPHSGQMPLQFERGNQRYLAGRLLVRSREAKAPRVLRMLQETSDRIELEIAALEILLRDYLKQETGKSISARKLRARVSIWEKRLKDDSEILYPTRFRYINPHDDASVEPGKTRYSLKGEGQGLPGMALVRHRAMATNGLPKWESDSEGYIRALAEFNLSRDMVTALGRKARSFLCFPMSIFKTANGETADTCICIDCADPLTGVAPETLTQIADMLREDADEILALLWLLRVST